MNESDFRDWARGQLRALDAKLDRLAAQKAEPARAEADGRIKGEMAWLADQVTAKLKAGRLAGLGVVFVTDEGHAMSGYAVQSGYFALGGAATFLGLEILEEFRKTTEAANDHQPAGHAGADSAPAEG
jgi:hypothetical protein